MKKFMVLLLALALIFTGTAVGFASEGTYNGDGWGAGGDIDTQGKVDIAAAAKAEEVTEVRITWTNSWNVTYTWEGTGLVAEGTAPFAWVADVTTDNNANVITFAADNDSSRAKTVTTVWADADDTTPGDYGLAVTLAGDLEGSGKALGYQGSDGDAAACTLTLAEKDAQEEVNIRGQAEYSAIAKGLDDPITLGTMTFTVGDVS